MNGISRKLPEPERLRLKKILKEVLPENVGVIVRTAAEGASEEQLRSDVDRLRSQWAAISSKVEKGQAPVLLHSEPDLMVKIIRDVFNEDFTKVIIDGPTVGETIRTYLEGVAPDDRLGRVHEAQLSELRSARRPQTRTRDRRCRHDDRPYGRINPGSEQLAGLRGNREGDPTECRRRHDPAHDPTRRRRPQKKGRRQKDDAPKQISKHHEEENSAKTQPRIAGAGPAFDRRVDAPAIFLD
jgi:hypothetical protein